MYEPWRWAWLLMFLTAQSAAAQDGAVAPRDLAVIALTECRLAIAVAAEAPWRVDAEMRRCDAVDGTSRAQADPAELACWRALDDASSDLAAAARLYERGRRTAAALQPRVIGAARAHHERASQAIRRADRCIQDLSPLPDVARTRGRRPAAGGAAVEDATGAMRAHVDAMFAAVAASWRRMVPDAVLPTLSEAEEPWVLVEYDRTTATLRFRTDTLGHECTGAAAHLPANSLGAAPGILNGGESEACLAIFLAHELGHHRQALRGDAMRGLRAELEADELAGRVVSRLVAEERFTAAEADRAMRIVAVFGGDEPPSLADPHGTTEQRYARMAAGFDAGLPVRPSP